MRAPRTLAELNEALANIMAGALSGDVKESEGRIALNAATRIIESLQAETRIRALAFATKTAMPADIPLNAPVWKASEAPLDKGPTNVG